MARKTYKKRSYRRSYRKRARTRSRPTLKRRINQILNKKTETKYFDVGSENVQLYHNLGYSAAAPVPGQIPHSMIDFFDPWADIIPGTGRQQRVGDKIQPVGMKLKLWLANKLDRPNVIYRVMIVRMPKAIGGTVTAYNNVYPFQTVDQGAVGNHLMLPLDKDKGIKAYYDRLHYVERGISQKNPGGAGLESHKTVSLWIKKKNSRPVIYSGGANVIVNSPLLLYVIPYDSFGTLITDNISSCAMHYRIYFKDL